MGGRDWTLTKQNVGDRGELERRKKLWREKLKARLEIMHRRAVGLEAVR